LDSSVDSVTSDAASVAPGETTGWGATDLLFLTFPVALCVAHGQDLFVFASFTSRMALLLAAGVPGLVALVDLIRRGDRTARVAGVAVAWIVVAAALSGEPLLALKGTIGRESSGLIMVAALGVWALGRRVSARAARFMPVAVLIGVGVNAIVGIAQVVFDIDTGSLASQFDRATGLTTNPVYFGGLMAAGAALAAAARVLPLWGRLAATVGFGLATNLSGSRVAVAAGLIAVGSTVLVGSDAAERRRQLAMPVAFLVGMVLSSIVTATSSGARSSTARLTEDQGGGGRLQVWEYGLSAIGDRPIFGWGFGRFRAATQGRYSANFVAEHASDDLRQAWFDAHNVVIGVAVAAGLVGLALLGWFVVVAATRMRGPLVFFVLALAGTWLLQPPGLVTLPLVLFLAGVAVPVGDATARCDRIPGRYAAALLVGVVVAGWLTLGDLVLKSATDDADAAAVESAARWFPHDAVVADLVAQSWFIEEENDPTLRDEVLEWSARAVSNERDRPYFLSRYALRLLVFEEPERAREVLDRSLELEPWHLQSWQLMYSLAVRTEDDELLIVVEGKLCALGLQLEAC
jgi:hypothetical protein